MRPQSRTSRSRIYRQSVDCVERFTYCFVQRRVRMDCMHHGLDCGFSFHRGDAFGDKFKCLRADDVNAQDLAVLRADDYLDETAMAAEDGRLAVSNERELTDL